MMTTAAAITTTTEIAFLTTTTEIAFLHTKKARSGASREAVRCGLFALRSSAGMVEFVTVYSKDDILFTMKDGTEIRV